MSHKCNGRQTAERHADVTWVYRMPYMLHLVRVLVRLVLICGKLYKLYSGIDAEIVNHKNAEIPIWEGRNFF